MKLIFWLFLFIKGVVYGKSTYSGFIDKYPIDLVLQYYSDGYAEGFYVYTKFDEPISFTGYLKNGELFLTEKNSKGKTSAHFQFHNFNVTSKEIKGTWKDIKSNVEFKVVLNKIFDFESVNYVEWKSEEILQFSSLKNRYFKLVTCKKKEEIGCKVIGIKIFEKQTDKLIQEINGIDCELRYIDNIETDDFNFDNIIDFSVFEKSYTGATQTYIYFLFDSITKVYYLSSFEPGQYVFDKKRKRVYKTGECCAGTSRWETEYKVIDNKLVFVKDKCWEFDNTTQGLIEIKCKN